MMRVFNTLILSGLSLALPAQAATTLPATWFGEWQGTCVMNNYNSDLATVPQPFGMTLNVQPLQGTPGTYRWQIGYDDEPLRDYRLIAQNDLDGHFITDERNGIILDNFLADGAMHQMFEINGKKFEMTFKVTGNTMQVDSRSYWAAGLRTSSLPDGSNQVRTFALRDTQRCQLSR